MSAQQNPICRGYRPHLARLAIVAAAMLHAGIAWPAEPPPEPPPRVEGAGSWKPPAPPAGDSFAWYRKRPPPDRKLWTVVAFAPTGEFVNLGKRTETARHGDIATAWTFTEFRLAPTDREHNVDYLGQAVKIDYDCARNMSRGYAAIRYPGPSMSGTPISLPTLDPRKVPWEPVLPDTTRARVMEWACALTAPGHKAKSGG